MISVFEIFCSFSAKMWHNLMFLGFDLTTNQEGGLDPYSVPSVRTGKTLFFRFIVIFLAFEVILKVFSYQIYFTSHFFLQEIFDWQSHSTQLQHKIWHYSYFLTHLRWWLYMIPESQTRSNCLTHQDK
jgi:hypothetical protein